MLDLDIKINEEELQKKIKTTKFWRLVRKTENPIYTFDLIEYLFSEDEQKLIDEKYPQMEDLQTFLMDLIASLSQGMQSKDKKLQEDTLPKNME